MSVPQRIDRFLALKRIAIVGVSHNEKDFSRSLFREFRKRGYDAVPVNPNVEEIDGLGCYKDLRSIAPPVEGVLVMTSPKQTDAVVAECAAMGIGKVWMYRAGGKGSVSLPAVEFCERHGIEVVPGYCPHMFFPNTPVFHRIHALITRLTGTYPK